MTCPVLPVAETFADEFGEYLAEQMQDPGFAAAYRAAERRFAMSNPRPLPVSGAEYRRRQRARTKRR